MLNDKISYKDSGVDTEAGRRFVESIKKNVHSTHNPRVLGGLGGFAAGFDVSFLKMFKEPVLLSCTDGVGTKLEIARLLDKHDTVGIDLVAMSVNDLLVSGARPLFFLDYISCGKLNVQKMEQIISGIVNGCNQCGAALIGGETAEHPGTMKEDEYDLAGFAVGAVEKSEMIDGKNVDVGDLVIGVESSGLHSNGFSLIRKLYDIRDSLPKEKSKLDFIRDYLMKPTRIYVNPIMRVLSKEIIHGMVHITGGGFYENIPRIFKKDLSVRIEKKELFDNYTFNRIKEENRLEEKEMFSTFNMGVGFMIFAPKESADKIVNDLNALGESAKIIGEVLSKQSEEVEIV